MKITDVEVIAVKGRHWPRFPMVFVEVHTDEGLTGLGEALPFQATGILESLNQLGEVFTRRQSVSSGIALVADVPSEPELLSLLKQYKRNLHVEHSGVLTEIPHV